MQRADTDLLAESGKKMKFYPLCSIIVVLMLVAAKVSEKRVLRGDHFALYWKFGLTPISITCVF